MKYFNIDVNYTLGMSLSKTLCFVLYKTFFKDRIMLEPSTNSSVKHTTCLIVMKKYKRSNLQQLEMHHFILGSEKR